jgi:large-conductance mechanosensitive channel
LARSSGFLSDFQAFIQKGNVDSINAWPAGAVIVALINFLVIAFIVYKIVRAIEATKRGEKAVAPPTPRPSWPRLSPAWSMRSTARGCRQEGGKLL